MFGLIAPVKQFLVDYKINNPQDLNTYYVRVVIKNSITGAVLDTLDLIDNGSQYFSKLWTTPPDNSGSGLQVVMFKSVYTDSGYTTISNNYGTTIENYVIRNINATTYGGFTRGGDLTRSDVEAIIEKAIKKIPPAPSQEKVEVYGHIKPVNDGLKSLHDKVDLIYEALDLSNKTQEEKKGLLEKLREKVLGSDTEMKSVRKDMIALQSEFKNSIENVNNTMNRILDEVAMAMDRKDEAFGEHTNRIEQSMVAKFAEIADEVQDSIQRFKEMKSKIVLTMEHDDDTKETLKSKKQRGQDENLRKLNEF